MSYNKNINFKGTCFGFESRPLIFHGMDFTIIKKNEGFVEKWYNVGTEPNNNILKQCISLNNCQLLKPYFNIRNSKKAETDKTWSVLLLEIYMS